MVGDHMGILGAVVLPPPTLLFFSSLFACSPRWGRPPPGGRWDREEAGVRAEPARPIFFFFFRSPRSRCGPARSVVVLGSHIDQPQVQTGIVRVWDETSILRLASVVVLGGRCGRSVGAESCRAAGAVSGTGDGRGHWYSGRRGGDPLTAQRTDCRGSLCRGRSLSPIEDEG